ncbi:MAG: hypothetical protein PF445_10705 [Melioribacteraceae bacterium]|jgi:hypothetical protein|nr:hypothetical protein [Melioribacteraceae bacterium]
MQNKKPLFIGIALALIFIFFVNGILQYLLLTLLGTEVQDFELTVFGLKPVFQLDTTINIYIKSFLLLSPVALTVLFMEGLFFLLRKSFPSSLRFTAIVVQVLLSGHLIVSVFYGLIELVLVPTNNSIWGKLVELWGLEGSEIYVAVFFFLVVLLGYLQITQKRLLQYLSENKSK